MGDGSLYECPAIEVEVHVVCINGDLEPLVSGEIQDREEVVGESRDMKC